MEDADKVVETLATICWGGTWYYSDSCGPLVKLNGCEAAISIRNGMYEKFDNIDVGNDCRANPIPTRVICILGDFLKPYMAMSRCHKLSKKMDMRRIHFIISKFCRRAKFVP